MKLEPGSSRFQGGKRQLNPIANYEARTTSIIVPNIAVNEYWCCLKFP